MNSLEIVSAGFAAGETKQFILSGSYFEIIDATDPVDVFLLDRYGAQRGVMRQAEASFHLRQSDFEQVQLVSATAQQIRFAYGSAEAGTRRATGAVEIIGQQGAFVQANATVTNASGQLLAANLARRYLLVQNNDSSGDIYVTLDGNAATTANGIKISAGGSLELSTYCPSGAINAIGSIANNPNIVTVEG